MPFKNTRDGTDVGDGKDVVCALAEIVHGNVWKHSGTAFFISTAGLALSAAHNFLPSEAGIHDIERTVEHPHILRVMTDDKGEHSLQIVKIKAVQTWNGLDIAILQAPLPLEQPPTLLHVSTRLPRAGDRVSTWSCPITEGQQDTLSRFDINHLHFSGTIVEHLPHGRDSFSLPGPCFQIEMDAPGGTSGGPIFNMEGHVLGVVSRSFGNGSRVAYGVPVAAILDYPAVPIEVDGALVVRSLRELGGIGYLSLVD